MDAVSGSDVDQDHDESDVDQPVAASVPWLTSRRVTLFTIIWLTAFALGSVAVSNPFATEPRAGVAPSYWHVMYLHGLLIGMVGLGALVVLQMLAVRCSVHVRAGIAVGVVAATVLSSVGGIWDSRVPGAEVAMWTQILGFFALDEILIMLIIGFWQGWRSGGPAARSLPYLTAWLASTSMLIAALMGHLAGWILEYGDHPSVLGRYAHFVGEPLSAFRDSLIGSHSHDMAVASMALILAAALQRFGYSSATGATRTVSRIGTAMVAVGVVGMTALYVAMAATTWVVPAYFRSANGTNGVAGDDLVTGLLVMGGGLLALWPIVVRVARRARSWMERPLPMAVAWSWTGIVLGVVIAGFWIELHEVYFGAGDVRAPGARHDAVFTWLHQDLGLFLFPALVAILLLSDRLAARKYHGLIGWSALAGVTALLLGGWIWVFVDASLRGPGYVVSTIGLLLVGLSIALTVVSGIVEDGGLRVVPHRRQHAEGSHDYAPIRG